MKPVVAERRSHYVEAKSGVSVFEARPLILSRCNSCPVYWQSNKLEVEPMHRLSICTGIVLLLGGVVWSAKPGVPPMSLVMIGLGGAGIGFGCGLIARDEDDLWE